MKDLLIERIWAPGEPATMGYFTFGQHTQATIERPWIPVDEHHGGKPFESCVPAGVYQLRKHVRSSGRVVVALENHLLSVYYSKIEMPTEGGRYKVLIHSGNWVKNVVGCVAPGLARSLTTDHQVNASRPAMTQLMAFLDNGDAEAQLTIRWIKSFY